MKTVIGLIIGCVMSVAATSAVVSLRANIRTYYSPSDIVGAIEAGKLGNEDPVGSFLRLAKSRLVVSIFDDAGREYSVLFYLESGVSMQLFAFDGRVFACQLVRQGGDMSLEWLFCDAATMCDYAALVAAKAERP